jgi:alpha-methylacyl-CoA racemase
VGQVVDAAMVDGAASLTTMMHSFAGLGMWREERGTNLLDTGAHFYEVYETKDEKYMAVGAIEPQFYAELLRGLGLEGTELPAQMDQAHWPAMKARFAEIFATKTRDEWEAIFAPTDACATPVLSPTEAATHPANVSRSVFKSEPRQPQPAPRFSHTPSLISSPPQQSGAGTREGLRSWGFSDAAIDGFGEQGAFGS